VSVLSWDIVWVVTVVDYDVMTALVLVYQISHSFLDSSSHLYSFILAPPYLTSAPLHTPSSNIEKR